VVLFLNLLIFCFQIYLIADNQILRMVIFNSKDAVDLIKHDILQ